MYVETGIFWAIVIGFVIILSIVYTTLNNKIFQMNLKIEEIKGLLVKTGRRIKGAIENDEDDIKTQLADIMDDLSFVYAVLGVIADGSNSTTKAKVRTLIKKRNAGKGRR